MEGTQWPPVLLPRTDVGETEANAAGPGPGLGLVWVPWTPLWFLLARAALPGWGSGARLHSRVHT